MLDSSLPISLQYQLRSELIEKINNKEWKEGDLIPSERELCDIYGISRITVREVLKDLVANGFFVRKQGKGTFVAEKKIESVMTSSFSLKADLQDKGIESSFIMLDYKTIDLSDFLAKTFELDNEKVAAVTRVRIIDGKKYAREISYVPIRYLPGATMTDIEKDGLYPTMKKTSGIFPTSSDEIIEAVNCPKDIAIDLDLKRYTAVIKVTRRTNYRGQCIEYCESYISGIRYNCHRDI